MLYRCFCRPITSPSIALVGHRDLNFFGNLFDDLLLAALAFPQRGFEHAVAEGVQVLKAEVFQLHLHAIDAKAVGDRGINIERLACDPPFFLGRHRAERLHVVQAVGKLDEDDANVLDHREHHLAKTFSLRFRTAAKFNLIQFADAVDQQSHFAAELFGYVIQRYGCVFDGVMQNRGGDCLRVETHLRELLRDRNRVRNVGFTGFSRLSCVCRGAEFIGGRNLGELLVVQVGFERFYKPPYAMVAPVRARQF